MNHSRAHHKLRRHTRQRGLTLTELMVALAISLIVLAGVITLYVTNRHAYALQDGVSRVQENGRFALDILARELRMAGFPKDDYGGGGFDSATSDGGGNTSDVIAVQYNADLDCVGNNQGGAASVHVYYIQDATLFCRPNGGAAQPLIDGIENLQVLYGEDTNGDGIPDVYHHAGNVTDWESVVTARVAVLAVTPREVRRTAQSTTHRVLDREIDAPSDKRLRRVYSSTIVLRNRMP